MLDSEAVASELYTTEAKESAEKAQADRAKPDNPEAFKKLLEQATAKGSEANESSK